MAFRRVSRRCPALSRRRWFYRSSPCHATAPPGSHALASVTQRSPQSRALKVPRARASVTLRRRLRGHSRATPPPDPAHWPPQSRDGRRNPAHWPPTRHGARRYSPKGGASTMRRSSPPCRSKLAARGYYAPDAAPGARPRSSRRLGRPSPPPMGGCRHAARRRATSSPPRRRRGEAPPLTQGPSRARGPTRSSRACRPRGRM